ncbi:AAA family ATPase [Streptomyces sp. NPDC057499]|uniref:AAA family ATPase n=1 Tax=Streptomyces sp. NPDC057499 TaxID=3346150 RepID=UPI0036845EB3
MVTTPPIRIGVTGTHSTGKTLLLRRIEMELFALDIAVARTGQLGRRAALVPLPKMQHHTADSTRWVIATGIADEVAAAARPVGDTPVRVVLADRACWDAIGYFRAAQEWSGCTTHRTEREALHRLAAANPPYDLLLTTVLDPHLPVRRKHDYDPRYRQLVDHHTHALLREENLPHLRVTSDPASQQRAVDRAVQLCRAVTPV